MIERVLGVYHSRREGKDDHIVIFVVHAGDGVTSLSRADPMEIEEAGWFSPDALPETLSPATKRRVAEYLAGDRRDRRLVGAVDGSVARTGKPRR